jgi:RNA polymerase subunit RPABC4/transcription elongation factor Spt4
VQTCSRCFTISPDSARVCANCQADLMEFSTTAVTLKKLKENPRVRAIRISVHADDCPVCAAIQATYSKDNVPHLPVEGCSHEDGCRCFFEPVLTEISP